MFGLRYDYLEPGGLSLLPPDMQGTDPRLNQIVALAGGMVKYYPAVNVGLYLRGHVNVRDPEVLPEALGGAVHPGRNLRSMMTAGVDLAF